VEQNLTEKIAAWTEGNFDEAALVEAIEAAAEDASNHRTGFGAVVDELTPEQQERCGDLIAYAFSLLDTLDNELQEVLDGLETADKPRVIVAGDLIVRASFQLNQAFAEFRNQALAALGPTDIPNLNHLISVKNDFVANPDEATRRNFQESIDVERVTTHDGVRALLKEPQIPEVVSLVNAFMSHMGNLNRLTEDLEKFGPEADFNAHFMALEMGFRELGDLVPMVSVALRAMGDTEYPDLNYLLTMLNEVESGNIGDGPLVEALRAVEMGFNQTFEQLQQALPIMETALAKEEIEGALKAFDEDFRQGIEAVYRFMTERETIRLSQARGFLLDFAKRLSGHKEKLKELEALEGKITCPRCSQVNDSDRQRCSQCGFGLPQNVGATTTSTYQTKEEGGLQNEPQEDLLLTGNLVKLYEAVNAIHAGAIDDAAFLVEVEKFETLVNAGVNSVPAEPTSAEPAKQNAVNEIYDAFEDGVELFKQGTEHLRSYLVSRDEDALKQGVTSIDQGAKKVAAAGKAVATAP
jgi:ribosomal protein L37E